MKRRPKHSPTGLELERKVKREVRKKLLARPTVKLNPAALRKVGKPSPKPTKRGARSRRS